MTDKEFIAQNKDADIHELALGKAPDGIDIHFCRTDRRKADSKAEVAIMVKD